MLAIQASPQIITAEKRHTSCLSNAAVNSPDLQQTQKRPQTKAELVIGHFVETQTQSNIFAPNPWKFLPDPTQAIISYHIINRFIVRRLQ